MSDVKQVKVDNWGIYFLQRLKHFFNRTDYCDLTLQFQDNAQLKVHRLVLSACTEYFELLERTCEMYEDCLVMPDDLQADVVVPIVNFMYTGHLEFRMDLLERLYQTSQILNMPVLSKLLEAHRSPVKSSVHSYSAVKRFPKVSEANKIIKPTSSTKRSYGKAFDSNNIVYRDKKIYQPLKTHESSNNSVVYARSSSPVQSEPLSTKKCGLGVPRPTRYELPEELDTDNVFDTSFCNISYACKPLMIHPETVKHYSSKRSGIFSAASSSKKILPGMSTVDIVECKRITKEENIFDESLQEHMNDDLDIFQNYNESNKDSSQLFDQILDDGPKVTIETRDSKVASNLDHAKIISEVLKKYPHLVKSNKNIKLKILNTPTKSKKPQKYVEEKPLKVKSEKPDYTYETDVIDSQQAAKLIALGAENTKGPWICLICGAPGKALHFTSYYKFRRHLVEVHNEKPVSNICEYCGLRSLKRNYLLHHLYSQHNIPPPPQYRFPKCDRCDYIALTEGFLIKHKLTHKKTKSFRCNVCSAQFGTTKELLQHIQATGHKYSAERKTNLQCIYCLKTFLRHGNLYAHLKTQHKNEAKNDGIIDDSDDEKNPEEITRMKEDINKYHRIKFEPSTSYDIYNENIYEEVDVQYQIQENHDGDIQLTPRKQHIISNQQLNSVSNTPKQKILNPGFGSPKPIQKLKPVRKPQIEQNSFLEQMTIDSPPITNNIDEDEIVLIDNVEYIMSDNQLIPRKAKSGSNEYIISDMMEPESLQAVQPTASMEYTSFHNANIVQDASSAVMVKKTSNINQPIQIVVSNEEEYKALMASNHPILFNNGDPNKTLTVLTTPHNAAMEPTTIDLNSAQTNDMMIIQQDFPLNVTEGVTTDNPNIVVVYSHPVDDQNKQYQILTTGGIGSQFVQSSAIITQNYETVTTSAPVMSGHVLEPQPDTTWTDNVQSASSEVMPTAHPSEIQNIIEHDEIKPDQDKNVNDLSELPEVHMVPQLQTIITQENLDNVPSNELSIINTKTVDEVAEQQIAVTANNIPDTHMESVILRDSVIEHDNNGVSQSMDVCNDNEHTEAVDNESNTDAIAHEPIEDERIVDQSVLEVTELPQQEEIAPVTVTENSVIVDTVAVTKVSEIAENDDLKKTLEGEQASDEPPQSQAYDDIVEVDCNVEKEQDTSAAKEKIQNLTSEWSEDEYEVTEDTPATLTAIPNPEQDVRSTEPEILEETIENIQQEVLNHVTNTTIVAATIESEPQVEDNKSTEENVEPSHEETNLLTATQTTVAIIENDPETQEKISSLLNDWEEIDSQEGNNSKESVVESKEESTDTPTENVAKPDLTIRNLVSDWDDDEEESKEQ